ncbi:uncharacterized protein LOC143431671 [Xylocopa sonorina]|uniref:uncharacterized protein LOC143431671 n=1 Tax=Xylocopa sonorina TaxID=1818115 RepID=UPI00403AC9A2
MVCAFRVKNRRTNESVERDRGDKFQGFAIDNEQQREERKKKRMRIAETRRRRRKHVKRSTHGFRSIGCWLIVVIILLINKFNSDSVFLMFHVTACLAHHLSVVRRMLIRSPGRTKTCTVIV